MNGTQSEWEPAQLRDFRAEFQRNPALAAEAEGMRVLAAVEQFITKYIVLPAAAPLVLSLWAIATYLAECFDAFPYISLSSPVPRCGKTRALEVLELLVSRPWRGTAPTEAALFQVLLAHKTPDLSVAFLDARNVVEVENNGHFEFHIHHSPIQWTPKEEELGMRNEIREARKRHYRVDRIVGHSFTCSCGFTTANLFSELALYRAHLQEVRLRGDNYWRRTYKGLVFVRSEPSYDVWRSVTGEYATCTQPGCSTAIRKRKSLRSHRRRKTQMTKQALKRLKRILGKVPSRPRPSRA
jgi:hypothetical protein